MKFLNKMTMTLSVLFTNLMLSKLALAVNIGGITTKATTFFTDLNSLLVIVGAGVAAAAFIWAVIEYFVEKAPISHCAKILLGGILIGGGVALVGASVYFGKSLA